MLLRENAKIIPEEFVAEKDFYCGNRKQLIDDKVNKDDKTIHTSNVPDPPDEMPHLRSLFAMGPSFLIHCHQLLQMKTSPLLPLMTKLN